MLRSFAFMLAIVLALIGVPFLAAGFWIPGGVSLALATLLGIWFWRSSNRALADEALRAAEAHDAAEKDV